MNSVFILPFGNYEPIKCYYFVFVASDNKLYLTCALSAVLLTCKITGNLAWSLGATITLVHKRHLLHLLGKLLLNVFTSSLVSCTCMWYPLMIPFRSFSTGGFHCTWIAVELIDWTLTSCGSPGTRDKPEHLLVYI